jgi:hypothetical protein
MMELNEVLAEIKKAKLKKAMDLSKIGVETRAAQQGRKRSAELRLPYLERDYKIALAKHLAVFLVVGDGASKFAELASEITKEESLDAEGLYKEILSRMPKEAASGKMAPKVIVDIMTRHLLDLASELEIASMPLPRYQHSKGFSVKNTQDLFRLIKRVLSQNGGAAMSAAKVLKEAAEQALKNEFDGDLYPVIVRLDDTSLADDMVEGFKEIIGNVNLLTTGELESKLKTKSFTNVKEVTRESVLDTLKNIKQTINKSGRKASTRKTKKESNR